MLFEPVGRSAWRAFDDPTCVVNANQHTDQVRSQANRIFIPTRVQIRDAMAADPSIDKLWLAFR